MITATVDASGVKEAMRKTASAMQAKFRGAQNPVKDLASRTARRMRALIRKSNSPSPVGTPPHTRGGRHSLKRAIAYAVEADGRQAIVGPDYAKVADVAYYHEHGGRQAIPGKRRVYKIGKIGPMARRKGYVTPTGKISKPLKGREDIAFGRIRTVRQLARAMRLDRLIWPNVEQAMKYRLYPRRPFRQKTLDTLSANFRATALKWRISIE